LWKPKSRPAARAQREIGDPCDGVVPLHRRRNLVDPAKRDAVAAEVACLVGEHLDIGVEADVAAGHFEPVQRRQQLVHVDIPEQLDPLVPERGDRAQGPAQVVLERIAHRVQLEANPGPHAGWRLVMRSRYQ
jgi:hypothetical protein